MATYSGSGSAPAPDSTSEEPWWASHCAQYSTKSTCNDSKDAVCAFDEHHQVCFPAGMEAMRRGAVTRLFLSERDAVQEYLKIAHRTTIDQWLARGCWRATSKGTCEARAGCFFDARKTACLPSSTKKHAGYFRDSEQLATYSTQAAALRESHNIDDILAEAKPLRFRIFGALAQVGTWASLGLPTALVVAIKLNLKHTSMSYDSWWDILATISKSMWDVVEFAQERGLTGFIQLMANVLKHNDYGAIGTSLATHIAMVHVAHVADDRLIDPVAFVKAYLQSFSDTTAPHAAKYHERRTALRKAQRDQELELDYLTSVMEKARQEVSLSAYLFKAETAETAAIQRQNHARLHQVMLQHAKVVDALKLTNEELVRLKREFTGPLLRSALVFGSTVAAAVAIHSTGYTDVMVLSVQVIFGCVMHAVRQITSNEADIVMWFVSTLGSTSLNALKLALQTARNEALRQIRRSPKK